MQLLSAATRGRHFVPMGAVEFVLFKLFESKLEHTCEEFVRRFLESDEGFSLLSAHSTNKNSPI